MSMRLARHSNGALKTLALWLGLVALTIQALAPLCISGMTAASGGNSIIICTAHGTETVSLDADGKPIPNAPGTAHHNSDCAMCGVCLTGGLAAQVAAVAAPSLTGNVERIVLAAPVISARAHVFYIGRAPPGFA